MPRYLVTSALPYANGPLHFGHAVGAYLPADLYVRTLRMQGEEVLYVCGTDEYGAAISIAADQNGKQPAEWAATMRAEIVRLFDHLGIEFDIFSGTSICPYHTELSQEFFRRLNDGDYLIKQAAEQLYSPVQERFLADRYVVGICPNCQHAEARGDECPNCGSWVDALALGDPRAKFGGEPLEKRATTHWYLDLPKLRDEHIAEWFDGKTWKPNVAAFVKRQLENVEPRPITRDLDWGIPVPADIAGDETGKVLYVWFDAPIGYVSMTREWAEREGTPDAWKAWWRPAAEGGDAEETRLVHFIGKDNIPFHCLVFPSMLYGVKQDYVLPWQVPANEFYNLQGRKFSTSGGWGIPMEEFFAKYDSEVTRFYLALSAPETSDSDWLWEDFQRCANDGLADTIGNLVTRVLRFLDKHFDGCVPGCSPEVEAELDAELLERSGEFGDPGEHVREFRFRRAAEQVLANARVANVFIDTTAPWALRKTDPERCGAVLGTACQWLALLARWMAPFLPNKSQELWTMLGFEGAVTDAGWPAQPEPGAWRTIPVGTRLGEVRGLFEKLEDQAIEGEIRALEQRAAPSGDA